MIKKILAAVGLGLGAYLVYQAYGDMRANSKAGSDESENDFFSSVKNVIEGGFMKVSNFTSLGMTTSYEGRQALINREGNILYAYYDSAGLPTIGVGHLIKVGEDFGKVHVLGRGVDVITNEESLALFAYDITEFEERVNSRVKVPLTQNQFDAVVSLAFNVPSILSRTDSTFLRLLNAGDYDGAAAQIKRWNKALDPKLGKKVPNKGLTARRTAEELQFRGQSGYF